MQEYFVLCPRGQISFILYTSNSGKFKGCVNIQDSGVMCRFNRKECFDGTVTPAIHTEGNLLPPGQSLWEIAMACVK